MSDNVREMWSDDELDTALATLRSEVDTDGAALARSRAELMAAAEATGPAVPVAGRPRHWARWAVVAAAIVALVMGLVFLQPGNPPVASAAARELTSAADRITGEDEPLGPGEYRYIVVHAWDVNDSVVAGSDDLLSYRAEHVIETWVPADERQEWMSRDSATGRYEWLDGSDAEAAASGIQPPAADRGQDVRARCGDFAAVEDGRPPSCAGEGSWQVPDEEFLASLPRDPGELFDRLRHDTAGRGSGPNQEMLVYAADLLRSGLVPADLRAALYRTLAMVPGIEITEKVANLDGHEGTAIGIAADGYRQEVIIDPDTGQFIGERGSNAVDGTVGPSTSVTTTVVDHLGETG